MPCVLNKQHFHPFYTTSKNFFYFVLSYARQLLRQNLQPSTKVLFTNHCRRQNFCPSLLCLVDRLYTVIDMKQKTRTKVLPYATARWMNSTLGAFHKLRLHLGWVGGQKNVQFTNKKCKLGAQVVKNVKKCQRNL